VRKGKQMNRIESYFRKATLPVAFALAVFAVAGCGDDDDAAAATPTPVDPVGAVCTGAPADCVPLLSAGTYVILAQSGVSTTGTSAVTGHVGLNAAAVGITGFGQTMDASNTFATSTQVTGRMYASDYTAPTPANLTQAITDTGAAFVNADAKIAPVGNIDLGAGNLTGLNLAPGVYSWGTGVSVGAAGTVTLTGNATDVWVFQISGGITMNPGATVTLAGGALPQNIFWRTAGVAALDTTSRLEGIVLSGSSVTLASGATVNGRLYATTAVTLIANTVRRPGS
jgi:hypothetical protein